jgi:hypothetical protein
LLAQSIGPNSVQCVKHTQTVDLEKELVLINTVLNLGGTLPRMEANTPSVTRVTHGIRMCAQKVLQHQLGLSLTPTMREPTIIVIILNSGARTMPALSEKFSLPLLHLSLPFL